MKEKEKKSIKTKEELNLVEYPLQYLGFKVPPDVKTVEWHGEVATSDGKVYKASWIVTGSDKYGLPRYKDRDVLLALLYFWKQQGFQSQILRISNVLKILELLKWDTSSKGYKELENSINRLVGVTIVATNSFWDNSTKDYLKSTAFHILDSADFKKEGHMISLTVKASDKFWESIKNGYLKTTDLDFYLSLETPLAKALYSYLDKKAYKNEDFKIEVMKLASHLGMSLNQGYKHIKSAIKDVSNLLITKGFLYSYNFEKEGETECVIFSFNREYLNRDVLEGVKEREERIRYIAEIMKRYLGGESIDAYLRIARYYPEEFIFRALGEVKEKFENSDLNISKYRLFKKILKNHIKEHFNSLKESLKKNS